MLGLGSLMTKEWRDARPLALACALLAPVLAIAVEALFLKFDDPTLTARAVLPAAVGLFAALLASDLVAGDVASRRIETLAALPASPLRAWTAKVAFLAAATAAFAAWMLIAELGLFAVVSGAGASGAVLAALPQALPLLVVTLPFAACALLFSTILDRGLAALLAAAAAVGGFHFGLVRLLSDRELGGAITPAMVAAFEVAIAVACLAGSAAAYRFGELHLPSKARRAAIGLGACAALLATPATAGAMALRRHLSLGPDNPDVRIVAMMLDPAETRVALGVEKPGSTRGAVWVLDLESGAVRSVEEGSSGLPRDPWLPDGDLSDGSTQVLVPEGVASCELSRDGARAIVREAAGRRPRVVDAATGRIVLEPRDERVQWITWAGGHRPSNALLEYSDDPHAPALIDVDSGRRTTLAGLQLPTVVAVTRDGRILVVRDDGAVELLDAEGKRVRRLLEPAK